MIKASVEAELKKEFRRIRENKLLIIGISIGIIGSLIAGVTNDLIKNSIIYPGVYLFILIAILLILIFVLLVPYLNWKIFQHKIDKRMKEMKKVLDKVKAHRKKYPV
ncbi:MAG: hypothetical protein KJ600_05000 [Nanoarchaeota archaeon]|nr:hypothetical protein [Nanoarchaeota archaeon]MBU1103888.1 hypothetical protein [Nanoarchaeota archaeon]